MTARVKSARHRALGRPSTPFDPVLETMEGVGRKTVVVVASSGLVAAGATAASAIDQTSTDVLISAEASAIIGTASLASVPDDAAWSLDVPQITVTAPEPEPEVKAEPKKKAKKAEEAPAPQAAAVRQEPVPEAPKEAPKAAAKPKAEPKKEKPAKQAKAAIASLVDAKDAEPKKKAEAEESEESGVKGSAVLEVAKRYIGVPYVYGGSTPRGFDCSGFTQYVYGQLGINLPHYSEAQPSKGRVVSRSQARPGDLIYTPGHVAIYAGGNKMIDSARTGTTVQVRSMWQRNPTFVRIVG